MTSWAKLVLLTSLLVTALSGQRCVGQSPVLHAKDLNGHPMAKFSAPGDRAVVFIFAATDCPISKRYIPEIDRIEKEFNSQGVSFWWVFPNPDDTVSLVRKHELDYSIHAKTLIDDKQELTQFAHVAVTPEAAVFSVDHGALREAYHGRIDDLYTSFGRSRPAATRHDLEDAITAVLAGRTPTPAAHGPVGCSIIPLAMVNHSK
jgi:thiol-disulfide isomerase/thioredoxin